MTLTRRQMLALAATLPLASRGWAQADSYPSKPITLILPFPAGGQTDAVARLLGRNLGEILGQQVLVDNRPGANSLIGTNAVARSAADGHTLLMNMTALVSNPIVLPNVDYDPIKEFTPVARLYEIAAVWAVPGDGPETLEQFITQAKAAKEPFAFGTTGHASSSHYFGEMLSRAANIPLNHIPYKGEAPLLPDLIAGRLQAAVVSSSSALQYGADGRIRILAASGQRRWEALPDLPLFSELGVPGMGTETFCGIFAPAGTPPAVVDKLHNAINQVAAMPEYKEQLLTLGLSVPPTLSPVAFGEVMKKAQSEWIGITKDSSIRIE